MSDACDYWQDQSGGVLMSVHAHSHCHLFPGSRKQKRIMGSFGNLAIKITVTKSIHSLSARTRCVNN